MLTSFGFRLGQRCQFLTLGLFVKNIVWGIIGKTKKTVINTESQASKNVYFEEIRPEFHWIIMLQTNLTALICVIVTYLISKIACAEFNHACILNQINDLCENE